MVFKQGHTKKDIIFSVQIKDQAALDAIRIKEMYQVQRRLGTITGVIVAIRTMVHQHLAPLALQHISHAMRGITYDAVTECLGVHQNLPGLIQFLSIRFNNQQT